MKPSKRNLSHQRHSVLIIDDHLEIRQFIKWQLENDYQILEASNGINGYQQIIKHKPNVVISDLLMPHMDGIELCKKIRGEQELAHIPVMILTVKSDRESEYQAIKNGANVYIKKPFDIDLIKIRLKGLIQNQSRLIKPTLDTMPQTGKSTTDEFETRIMQCITSNFHDPEFSVKSMATQMGCSQTQLYRKVRAYFHQPAKELIQEYRMKKAKEMLNSDKKPTVAQVAYAVGFNSPNYFGTCFRNRFGHPPSQSRFVS
ncbi:DNA-binding response regulator [Reichenbachiella carrageenanivorans]|uniref:DNA-binding response regulator n=1 Tax=Reichenbachiella carrageenanivorans TaxID=2979869 RepID=A0ABY6DAX2_9BACT|nr:DNA-binding response regulator [Reichenbachiella carrageenanivorans]UXX80990.1 DNA-binding response regulator [Reichenbachiella carrageenanivorans]